MLSFSVHNFLYGYTVYDIFFFYYIFPKFEVFLFWACEGVTYLDHDIFVWQYLYTVVVLSTEYSHNRPTEYSYIPEEANLPTHSYVSTVPLNIYDTSEYHVRLNIYLREILKFH